MPDINEPGVVLTLPDNNFFRFQDCQTYNKLKGNGLKEMDVCWLDTSTITLYVIELKDWQEFLNVSDTNGSKEIGLSARAKNIIEKLKDSLLMLNAIEIGRGKGATLSSEINLTIPLKKKFFVIVNAEPTHKTSLLSIENKVRSQTDGFMNLMGFGKLSIIDKSQVNKVLPLLFAV